MIVAIIFILTLWVYMCL